MAVAKHEVAYHEKENEAEEEDDTKHAFRFFQCYKCQLLNHWMKRRVKIRIGLERLDPTPSGPNYKSPLTFFGEIKVAKYVIKL